MRYGITRLILGPKNFIEITSDKFEEAKKAQDNLLLALSMEEKINILLENYAEYEEELLRLTMHRMLFSQYEWSSFMDDINIVNRRLMNLLATCRLYIDHVQHDISTIYGNSSEQVSRVNSACSKEYDSCLGYRVLDALRNYAQHRGLLISQISHWSSAKNDKFDRQRMRHTIIPMININPLKEDKKLQNKKNKAILIELEAIGEDIDIRPLVRDYITSIGRIHFVVRDMIRDDLAQWDNTLQRILKAYQDTSDASSAGLAVVAKEDNGRNVEAVRLSSAELIKRRKRFIQKNNQLSHFSYSYVSGEVVPTDD